MTTWYTLEDARADWPGLGAPDDEQLQLLLDVSQAECLAFSPVTTTVTAPTPITLEDGAWTVALSGTGETVQANISTDGGGPATVALPAEFQPVGSPSFEFDATTSAYFQVGNPVILNLVADLASVATFTMYWTAANPSQQVDIPDGHRWAHLAHARNIWNAQKANPSGGLGDETQGFALTPFPMDWAVRARLRPRVLFGGAVG